MKSIFSILLGFAIGIFVAYVVCSAWQKQPDLPPLKVKECKCVQGFTDRTNDDDGYLHQLHSRIYKLEEQNALLEAKLQGTQMLVTGLSVRYINQERRLDLLEQWAREYYDFLYPQSRQQDSIQRGSNEQQLRQRPPRFEENENGDRQPPVSQANSGRGLEATRQPSEIAFERHRYPQRLPSIEAQR